MKRLTATICLTIAVLLGSAGVGYALPRCPEGRFWHDCVGTYSFSTGRYVGEFRDGKKHAQGTCTFADGRIDEGICKDGKFQYAQKVTPLVVARKPPSPSPRKRADPDKVVAAASGSGFAVSSKGHVITNNHVIDGMPERQDPPQGQGHTGDGGDL